MTDEEQIEMSKKILEDFKEAAKPLVKFLNDHFHPHVEARITPIGVELFESLMFGEMTEFIRD